MESNMMNVIEAMIEQDITLIELMSVISPNMYNALDELNEKGYEMQTLIELMEHSEDEDELLERAELLPNKK